MKYSSSFWKRIFCAALCVSLAAGTAAGCASEEAASSAAPSGSSAADVSEADGQAEAEPIAYDPDSPTGGLTLPLTEEDVTITYWIPLNDQAKGVIQNYNENQAIQELEKRTGVKVDFQHPPVGQETEQYKLLIVSDDLPDVIEERGTAMYPGGGDKAIEDGVFLRLNELMENNAPNYMHLREESDEIRKLTITDAGNIWSFGMIQNFDALVWNGPIVRKDILDDLGIDPPETIEDWYAMLTAMKESGVEIPLLFPKTGRDSYGCFLGSYNIAASFYVDDGTVKFGPYEEAMKDYLTEMNKWYTEGLIDQDFASRDSKMTEALATSGRAGAWIGTSGIEIESYLVSGQSSNPDFELYGASYPLQLNGEKSQYRQVDQKVRGYNASITTSCECPELVTQWLDYRYSEEGSMLFNYGTTEGVTYEINEDGEPRVLQDVVLSYPENEGLAFTNVMWKYKINDGAMNRMNTAPLDSLIPESQQARVEWGESAGTDSVLPTLTMTTEEASEYNSIMNEINTYTDQMILKFFIGDESLDAFDSYREQLQKMNIERAIEIQQAAYDRYLAR